MPYTKTDPPIYYESKGQGPAIIWSHGMMMDHDMFEAQVDYFSKSYQCITWDERGHGKTAQDHCEPFTYYDSAGDVMAILDDLHVDEAILAGMSQGGYLSLRAALKYPSRVKALILIGTQAALEPPEVLARYDTVLAPSLQAGHLTEEFMDWRISIFEDPSNPGQEFWKNKWREAKMHSVVTAFKCLTSRDDISDKMPKITAPAIVIHGNEDKGVPLEKGEELHRGLPNSTLVRIEGHRHAPNMTAPNETNASIERFLNGLSLN